MRIGSELGKFFADLWALNFGLLNHLRLLIRHRTHLRIERLMQAPKRPTPLTRRLKLSLQALPRLLVHLFVDLVWKIVKVALLDEAVSLFYE